VIADIEMNHDIGKEPHQQRATKSSSGGWIVRNPFSLSSTLQLLFLSCCLFFLFPVATGQIPPSSPYATLTTIKCNANTIMEADTNIKDGVIDMDEYQLLLFELAPLNCHILDSYNDKDNVFLNEVWTVLTCDVCKQMEVNNDHNSSSSDNKNNYNFGALASVSDSTIDSYRCCDVTSPRLRIPGYSNFTEPSYSDQVCQILDDAIVAECNRLDRQKKDLPSYNMMGVVNETIIDTLVNNIAAVLEESSEVIDDSSEGNSNPFATYLFSSEFIALVWIQRISSILSIVGSSSILYSLLRYRKMFCCNKSGGKATTATLILFIISLCDLLSSLALGAGTWPIPRGNTWQSYGNDLTCTLQGFFFHTFATMASGYNVMQVLYFVLTVCYQMKEDRFFTKPIVRFVFLVFPFLMVFGYNMWPLFDNAFSYSQRASCSYEPYPLGCNETGTCTKGVYANTIRLYATIFTIICAIIITVSVLKLYWFVLQTERALDKYNVTHHQVQTRHQQAEEEKVGEGEEHDEEEIEQRRGAIVGEGKKSAPIAESQKQKKKRTRSKLVALQGIYYAGCFLVTYLLWFVFCFRKFAGLPPLYWIQVVIHTFIPLQGFLNAFVYFRQNKKEMPAMPTDLITCLVAPKWKQHRSTVLSSG